jgi:hypothetical protein
MLRKPEVCEAVLARMHVEELKDDVEEQEEEEEEDEEGDENDDDDGAEEEDDDGDATLEQQDRGSRMSFRSS